MVSEIDPRDPSTFFKSAKDFTVNLSGRKILLFRISGNDLESFENPLDLLESVSLASRSSFLRQIISGRYFPKYIFRKISQLGTLVRKYEV